MSDGDALVPPTEKPADTRSGNIKEAAKNKILDLSEYQLIAAAQAGDHRAFHSLYDTHVGMVYGLCLRMISDASEAELLTQDVFVKAWQKLDSYQRRGPFGGWLRRITINTIIEERRRRARVRKVIDGNLNTTATENETTALHSVSSDRMIGALRPAQENTELLMELEKAITKLPAGAKTAFVLHDVEGYRHREIAVMTGVAIGTVKAQLHRARRLLRQALTSSGEGVFS